MYVDLNIRVPYYSIESVDFCLSNATIAKISEEELPTVTQLAFGKTLGLHEAISALVEKYSQIKLLLVTCGGEGAYCYDKNSGETLYCPSEDVSVVSTVGAGDSFGAVFLAEYAATGDIPFALKTAARVSGYVVAHKGAVPSGIKDYMRGVLVDGERLTEFIKHLKDE